MPRDPIADIQETIEKIRPFIQMDGGDIEFVKFEDGTVFIRLLGACVGCGLIDITLRDGIEKILLEEVPGVIDVQLEEQT